MSGRPDSESLEHTRPPRPHQSWWQRTGEPYALATIGLAQLTLLALLLLGVLTRETATRLAVGLGWTAGVLLLLRLPRLLRHERGRVTVLAGVGIVAMLVALVTSLIPSRTNQISDAQAAELVEVLTALHDEAAGNPGNTAALGAGVQRDGLTFVAPPRISRDLFAYLLKRGAGAGPSPAAPYAYELYDIIVAYGIDPAVALAFFAHESQFCRTGVCLAHDTKGWGAQRAAYNRKRAVGYAPGPFVRFGSWADSVRDWCELILYRYVNRGLDTVEEAVPVYAPASDGNVPTSYINIVRRMVFGWQGRQAPAQQRDNQPRVYTGGLENALITEAFRASGLEYHAEWAFHRYALDEARAGRSLGVPLDESRLITVDGKRYAVQTFALDTLYTPLAEQETETNWNDVRRFSTLLKQNKITPTPGATGTPTPDSSGSPTKTAPTATPQG